MNVHKFAKRIKNYKTKEVENLIDCSRKKLKKAIIFTKEHLYLESNLYLKLHTTLRKTTNIIITEDEDTR